MRNSLTAILIGTTLLIVPACNSASRDDISLREALALASTELFAENASAIEPIKVSMEVVETLESWDFLFEFEPGAPGMHSRIIVSKIDGSVEALPSM